MYNCTYKHVQLHIYIYVCMIVNILIYIHIYIYKHVHVHVYAGGPKTVFIKLKFLRTCKYVTIFYEYYEPLPITF